MLSYEAPHPNWEDLLKALKIIELYDRIEKQECDEHTLQIVRRMCANHDSYDEPASFVRYVIYPEFMEYIGCTDGWHKFGRDSFALYDWDYPDADLFFNDMISHRWMRINRIEVAKFMCKDSAEEYL